MQADSETLMWQIIPPLQANNAEQPDKDLRQFTRCYAVNLPLFLKVVTNKNFNGSKTLKVPLVKGCQELLDDSQKEEALSMKIDTDGKNIEIVPSANVVFLHPQNKYCTSIVEQSKELVAGNLCDFFQDDPKRHLQYALYIPFVQVDDQNWQPLWEQKERSLPKFIQNSLLRKLDNTIPDKQKASFGDEFFPLEIQQAVQNSSTKNWSSLKDIERIAFSFLFIQGKFTGSLPENVRTASSKLNDWYFNYKENPGDEVNLQELVKSFRTIFEYYLRTIYKEQSTNVFMVALPKNICAVQRHFFDSDLYNNLDKKFEKKFYIPTILPSGCFPVPKRSLGGHLCPKSCDKNQCLSVADEWEIPHETFCSRLNCAAISFDRNNGECNYEYTSPDHLPHVRRIESALIPPHQNPSVVWERLQNKALHDFDPQKHRIVKVERRYVLPYADSETGRSFSAETTIQKGQQPLTVVVLVAPYEASNPHQGAMCYTTVAPVDRIFSTFAVSLDPDRNLQ